MPYKWTDSQQQAFDTLKNKLREASILVCPNYDKEFTIYSDASGVAIVEILAQLDKDGKNYLVAYVSRVPTKQEKKL